MSRRSWYTRASDVIVRDAVTGEVKAKQRRYSPSELNAVKSGRHSRKVRRAVEAKTQEVGPAEAAYLDHINAS